MEGARCADWTSEQRICPLERTVTPRRRHASQASLFHQMWGYCHRAQAPDPSPRRKGKDTRTQPKISPGVAANVPGATLELTVDTRLGSRGPEACVRVGIEHLVSYDHMGVVRIACKRRCRCKTHDIDAHRTSAVRNDTVFVGHWFDVIGANERCNILFTVLNRTSSGGHKFKLRSLTLKAAEHSLDAQATDMRCRMSS